METRRQALKKRKTEEDDEASELIQTKLSKDLNRSSFDVGPRDFIISQENQSPVDPDIGEVMKQEIKIESLEEEKCVDEGVVGEFECESSQVKFEIEDRKIFVLNEGEVILSDDKNEISDTANFSKEKRQSEELLIKSESKLKNLEEHGQHENGNLEKVLPLILDYLELSKILLCRKISKKWRQIVDDFLHSKISEEPFDNELNLKKMKRSPSPQLDELLKQKYSRIKYAYIFGSNLKKFSEKMKEHCDLDLSPFVGHAKVYLRNTNQETKYLNRYRCSEDVCNFMKYFGKYLTSLKIEEKGIGCSNTKFYFGRTIQMCLENCPNLKSFSVQTEQDGDGVRILQPRVNSFEDSLKPNGLILPKNLNSFSLRLEEDNDDVEPNLTDLLMEKLIEPFYKEKILKLKIIWNEDLELIMPQLKDLTLYINCEETEDKRVNFDRLLSGKWLEAPKIEKFCLKSESSTCPDISFSGLLKIMRIFTTIRFLKLDYPISSTMTFKNVECFRSNNIHTLEITDFYGDDKLPVDFIGAFPKLKYLKMRISYILEYSVVKRVRDNLSGRRVPVKLFREKIIPVYESEIWKICEDLENVVIKCHMHKCDELPCWSTDLCRIVNVVGTREGYKEYCKKLAEVK